MRSDPTSPNVTAFVQGPNGQYFVPGKCLMPEHAFPIFLIMSVFPPLTFLCLSSFIVDWFSCAFSVVLKFCF